MNEKEAQVDEAETPGTAAARQGRRLLPERVYQSLRRQILSGELAAGERLQSEHQMAAHFLVSRPVVREALLRLREEKLIFSRRGAGSFVRVPNAQPPRKEALGFAPVETIADIQRCYEFRLTIESEQAFEAALRWNDAALKAIADAVELMHDATLAHQHREDADLTFHSSIAGATNNHYFLETMVALRMHIAIGMRVHGITLLTPPEGLAGVFQEHLTILQAIRERDAPRARDLMRHHLEGSRDRIFEGRALDLSL